jgi:hypothetical protein
MELDYFISQSSDPLSVRDVWKDTSSLNSRSFIYSKNTPLTGIAGNNDFSLLCTFYRSGVKAGTLISNYTPTGGFAIGFNENNELFAYGTNPTIDSIYFPEIRLGQKNSLAIIKNDQRITVFRYDHQARDLLNVSSKSFRPETNLTGGAFSIGYNSSLNAQGLSGVSGIFDQLLCLNRVIDEQDSLVLFSGFLPIQVTQSTIFNRYYYENFYEQSPNPGINDTLILRFTGFLNSLSSYIPTGTGLYIASLTGYTQYTNSSIYWSGYYGQGEGLSCFITGGTTYMSSIYPNYYPPAISGFVRFTDQVYYSMNENFERITNHLFSYTLPSGANPNQEHYLSYTLLEKYKTKVSGLLTSPTGSYTSGLFMHGIVADKRVCTLGRYDTKSYKEVGLKLPFDKSHGKFLDTEDFVDGYNLYWGPSIIASYYTEGKYIITASQTETNDHDMIFDKSNANPTSLSVNYNFATGRFPAGAPSVFLTKIGIGEDPYRSLSQDFYETSNFHLINGKSGTNTLPPDNSIYSSDEDNWTTSLLNDLS